MNWKRSAHHDDVATNLTNDQYLAMIFKLFLLQRSIESFRGMGMLGMRHGLTLALSDTDPGNSRKRAAWAQSVPSRPGAVQAPVRQLLKRAASSVSISLLPWSINVKGMGTYLCRRGRTDGCSATVESRVGCPLRGCQTRRAAPGPAGTATSAPRPPPRPPRPAP